MQPRPTVSLVIPAFNEEENIEHAIGWATDALVRYCSDWEIIVVDDASTDGSPALMDRAAARDPHIRILRHPVNRKLGGTLKTGFAAASMELVLYMDADLPFDPDDIGRAIRALYITGADMIAGYRLDRTMEGLVRTVYSYLYNFLINALFGWPHRDINFSFKLMRLAVLRAIELRSEGSLIDAELIVKAKNLGFVIQQLGLDYFPRTRGQSTLSSFGVIFKMLRELVALAGDMRHPTRRDDPTPASPAPPSAAS